MKLVKKNIKSKGSLKQILLVVLFIVCFVFIESCQDEESIVQVKISAVDFENIGLEHNSLLSETYLYLHDNITSLNQQSEIARKNKLQEFLVHKILENKKYPRENASIGKDFTVNLFRTSKNLFEKEEFIANNSLSENEIKVLASLDKILSFKSFENSNVVKQIEDLNRQIEFNNELTSKELIVLYSATSIAKYSFLYWKENISSWEELASNDLVHKNLNVRSGPGGNIVKADVAGGVGAAAGTWLLNALPGPGNLAYGSAIIGGAGGASVYQAVTEILNWLW